MAPKILLTIPLTAVHSTALFYVTPLRTHSTGEKLIYSTNILGLGNLSTNVDVE